MNVVATIAKRAAFQLVAGVVVGIGFGWWLLGQISDNPEFLDTNIPLLLASVSVVVVVVMVAVACLSPVLRSPRVKPTEALREG